MTTPQPILYCRCAYAKAVPKDVKDEVLRQLTDSDVAFDAVADLCEMSAKRDPALELIAKQPGLRIAACYPRAVKWLFSAAGTPLEGEGIEVVNMRSLTAEQTIGCLLKGDPIPSTDEAEDQKAGDKASEDKTTADKAAEGPQ